MWNSLSSLAARGLASRAAAACLCLLLLTPGAATAQAGYRFQPVIRLLDFVGEVASDGWFRIGSLDDSSRLVFATMSLNDAGGHNLLLYGEGDFQPLVLPEAFLLGWEWPKELRVLSPVSINQSGRVLFAATPGRDESYGVFLWEGKADRATGVALPGDAILSGFTLASARFAPVINNPGAIALKAAVRAASGQTGDALLFRDEDGAWRPILLPDGPLPDGGNVGRLIGPPSLDDAGRVAFIAARKWEQAGGAYVWDGDTVRPVAVPGASLLGGKIATVAQAWVNNRNREILVAIRGMGATGPFDALCREAAGALVPLVASGQEMPDGGRLLAIQSVSFANEAGDHVFVAALDSGTAAYLLTGDGRLSLVLGSGAVTELGRVAAVGPASTGLPSSGIGLNSRGQIALPVRIDNQPPMILLATPR